MFAACIKTVVMAQYKVLGINYLFLGHCEQASQYLNSLIVQISIKRII